MRPCHTLEKPASLGWCAAIHKTRPLTQATVIKNYNEAYGTTIVIQQVKYWHNIVAQDHRAIKHLIRPMLGCKAFNAAQGALASVELMHILRKSSW